MVQLARRAPVALIRYAGIEAGSTRVEFLGDEIAELAAHLDAATYRLLTLLHEFDAREGWHTGFRTCAHWADGGATSPENLVLLCPFHHRLLHEDGYAMSFDAKRDIVFRDPEGVCIRDTPVPEPVCGDAVQRFREDHTRGGLEIDEDTAPLGDGGRLDLHLAILMLRPT